MEKKDIKKATVKAKKAVSSKKSSVLKSKNLKTPLSPKKTSVYTLAKRSNPSNLVLEKKTSAKISFIDDPEMKVRKEFLRGGLVVFSSVLLLFVFLSSFFLGLVETAFDFYAAKDNQINSQNIKSRAIILSPADKKYLNGVTFFDENQKYLSEDVVLTSSSFSLLADNEISLSALNFLNSADGKNFAYVITKDNKSAVVLNGQTGPFYDAISFMVFSPNSSHFAYGVRDGDREMVVIDGKEGKLYDWVFLPRFFTPDSRFFVYKARTLEGDLLVFNETESELYEQIYTPFVTSDKKELVFYARNGEEIFKNSLSLEKYEE